MARPAARSYAPTQRLRCPCCGEIFVLADAELVDEPAVGAELAAQPAAVDRPEAIAEGTQPASALPIALIFDGGSIGNPGRGYGSYQLTVRDKAERPQRLELGEGYTNNEAEYDTLLAALEAILRRARDPRRVRLEIKGDSQLVINQINGVWKAKEPRMRERLERVRALLAQLGGWSATWHERGKSVKALGH
jgi:ribonuclease HI